MADEDLGLAELFMVGVGFVLIAAGGVTFGTTTVVGVAIVAVALGVEPDEVLD